MMNFLKRAFLVMMTMMGILAGATVPVWAAEDDSGNGTEFYSGVCDDDNIDEDLKKQAGCEPERELTSVAVTVINAVIAIIGLVAVVIIIIGGIQYTTSLGDASKINQARNMVIYGVIGLVVGMLAWAIASFIAASVQPYN